jgi:uncharacterized membrane protein
MEFLALQGSIRWVFLIHVVCGVLALLAFTVPLFSKKGGRRHIQFGWLYTYAMVVVGVSALAITPWRVFLDEARTPGTMTFSLFLFFVAVFTLCCLHFGIVVLRAKGRVAPSKALTHIAPPVLLVVLSLVTQGVGLKFGNTLLMVFPVLALLTAKGQLTYWLTAPSSKRHWWYAHMSGMSIACIATVTAFLVTAVPRLWPNSFTESPILWVLPGAIGGYFLKRATARYRMQFGESQLAT